MKTDNERGLTLVEVLATVIILSIISILAWRIFFQGTEYSKKAVSKNQMQQEANIIIASLNSIHKRSIEYSIDSSNCKISVQYTTQSTTKTEVFENSQMCIQANDLTITPKTTDADLNITIEEKGRPKNKIQINSLLSRLKEEKK